MGNLTIEKMIDFIGNLIDLKNIKIEENAHDDSILYIEIKDKNNFITCSIITNLKLIKLLKMFMKIK